MRYASDSKEIEEIEGYMEIASEEAKKSTCRKAQRGVVIVKNGAIIGKGYNEPLISELCCLRDYIQDNSQAELCTGLHAEQAAIINAYRNGERLEGSRMLHVKIKNGDIVPSRDPSCTVCSRIIYKSGISEFVLKRNEGYAIYEAEEFNKLSFDYFLNRQKA